MEGVRLHGKQYIVLVQRNTRIGVHNSNGQQAPFQEKVCYPKNSLQSRPSPFLTVILAVPTLSHSLRQVEDCPAGLVSLGRNMNSEPFRREREEG